MANGTPDVNPSFTQGSTVEYVCDLGYEFRTEESDTYSIECQTDDTWSPITDCEGKVPCHSFRVSKLLYIGRHKSRSILTVTCGNFKT